MVEIEIWSILDDDDDDDDDELCIKNKPLLSKIMNNRENLLFST